MMKDRYTTGLFCTALLLLGVSTCVSALWSADEPTVAPSSGNVDRKGSKGAVYARVLWINTSNGQTDATNSSTDGTGSIYNRDKGGLSYLAEELRKLGIENTQVLENDTTITVSLLNPYNIAVFAFNLHQYTQAEADALAEWVGSGGRAFFFAGFAEHQMDAVTDNMLLEQFGIRFGDPTTGRLQKVVDFEDYPITEGVREVHTDVGDYIEALAEVEVLARYQSRPVLAAARYGAGEVLAFWDNNCFLNGVYSAWDLPCIHDVDNMRFGINIFTSGRWLLRILPPASSVSGWELYE